MSVLVPEALRIGPDTDAEKAPKQNYDLKLNSSMNQFIHKRDDTASNSDEADIIHRNMSDFSDAVSKVFL